MKFGILKRKKAKYIFRLFAAFFLICFVFFVHNKDSIFTDSDLGILKSKKEFKLVLNGKQLNFLIKTYRLNETNKEYLFTHNLLKVRRIELPIFVNDVSLCNKEVLKIGKKEIICFYGDVGVHSQNIVFLNDQMSLVKIKQADNVAYNVVTDAPNYTIQDYNNDNFDDLIFDNRNYDKDPLLDVNRSYFKGTNDGFVFDKTEQITVK